MDKHANGLDAYVWRFFFYFVKLSMDYQPTVYKASPMDPMVTLDQF
jgi:hypothetical protein